EVIDKVCTEGIRTFRHELSVAGAIPSLVHVFCGEYQLAPTIEDAHPETVYELSVNDKLVVKPVTIGGEGAGIGKFRVAGYHHCIGNGLAEPAYNSCSIDNIVVYLVEGIIRVVSIGRICTGIKGRQQKPVVCILFYRIALGAQGPSFISAPAQQHGIVILLLRGELDGARGDNGLAGVIAT